MRWFVLIFIPLGVFTTIERVDAQGAPSFRGASLQPTRGRNVLFIVTHDTYGAPGSGVNSMNAFIQGRGRPGCERCGTEWWIMANGDIHHATGERVTSHCGNAPSQCMRRGGASMNACNSLSVGIEFEGFPYLRKTEAQVRSGLELIRFLQDRYCIGSRHIYAHNNDCRGEGVIMQDAGRRMGHEPSGCVNIDPRLGVITDDSVNRTIQDSDRYQPPLGLVNRGPGTYIPSFQPPPIALGGFQGLFNAFGAGVISPTLPTTLMPTPSAPSSLTALQNLAYPDPHASGGLESAESRAADAAAQKYPGAAISVVIPSGSSTATVVVKDVGGATTTDVVSVKTEYVAPSTFTPPSPPQNIPTSVQNTTSGIYAQLVDILTRVRSILTTLVGYLRGQR